MSGSRPGSAPWTTARPAPASVTAYSPPDRLDPRLHPPAAVACQPGYGGWGTQPPQDGGRGTQPPYRPSPAVTSGPCEAYEALSFRDLRQSPALAGILPEDQGGGAVLRPERRDGQPAGTRAPRRELHLGREAQLGHQAVTAGGPPEADQGTAADPGLRHGGQPAGGHGHEFQLHRLRAVGRVVAEAQLDRQKAAVGAEGRVGHRTRRGQPDRFGPAR